MSVRMNLTGHCSYAFSQPLALVDAPVMTKDVSSIHCSDARLTVVEEQLDHWKIRSLVPEELASKLAEV